MRFLWEDLLHFFLKLRFCPVFLESKLENSDKVTYLFGNHQGGNDVNYEAAFQKRKQAPMTESNPSSKPKVTEVRIGKETDITISYQQHLKRLIADNNSDIESSRKKIEELHTLIDTKNKDNKKLQSIYDAISELH